MKELAETGTRVFIQHNGDTDQNTAVATVEHNRVGPNQPEKVSKLIYTFFFQQKCPILYLEYNQQPSIQLKGAGGICNKLRSLNSIAHKGDQVCSQLQQNLAYLNINYPTAQII